MALVVRFSCSLILFSSLFAGPLQAGPVSLTPDASQAPPTNSGANSPSSSDNGVVYFSTDDQEMNAAMRRGQATLPRFEAIWAKKKPARYTVKIPLVTGPNTEYVWVEITSISTNLMKGRLASNPRLTDEFQYGQELSISKSSVRDWMVEDGNEVWGGYTNRVILSQENSSEAREALRQYRD
jgi:uncharacterized protein YegJ (DUF2314 family)